MSLIWYLVCLCTRLILQKAQKHALTGSFYSTAVCCLALTETLSLSLAHIQREKPDDISVYLDHFSVDPLSFRRPSAPDDWPCLARYPARAPVAGLPCAALPFFMLSIRLAQVDWEHVPQPRNDSRVACSVAWSQWCSKAFSESVFPFLKLFILSLTGEVTFRLKVSNKTSFIFQERDIFTRLC